MPNKLGHISTPSRRDGNNANSSNKRGKKRRRHSPHEDSDDGDEDNVRISQCSNAPTAVISPQFCPYYMKEPHHKDFCENGKLHKSCKLKHISKLLQHIRRTHTKPVQCDRCGFRGDAGQVKEHRAKTTKCEKKHFERVSQEDLRVEEILKSSKQGLSSSELFRAIFGSGPEYEYARNYEACERALPALTEIFQEYSRQNSDIVWRVARCFRDFSPFKKFSNKHPDANFEALGVKFWIERHVLNFFASITEPSGAITSDAPVSTQPTTNHSVSHTPYQAQTLQDSNSCDLTPQSLAMDATNSPSTPMEPLDYQPDPHFGPDISQSLSPPIFPQARKDSNSPYHSDVNQHPGDINSPPPRLQAAIQHQQGNQSDYNNLQVTQRSSSMGAQISYQTNNNPSPLESYENDPPNDRPFLVQPSHNPPPETAPHGPPEDESIRRSSLLSSNTPRYSHTSSTWPPPPNNYLPTANYNQINGIGSQFEAVPGPIAAHLVRHPLSQGHQPHNLADNGHTPINLQFAAQQFHSFSGDHSIYDDRFSTEYYSPESSFSTPQSEVTCRQSEPLDDNSQMQLESSPTHTIGAGDDWNSMRYLH